MQVLELQAELQKLLEVQAMFAPAPRLVVVLPVILAQAEIPVQVTVATVE
jgi:hypothetical protein